MAITPTAVDTSLTKRKSAGGGGAQMPLQMSLSGRISPMDAMASTPSHFRCQAPQGAIAQAAGRLDGGVCERPGVQNRMFRLGCISMPTIGGEIPLPRSAPGPARAMAAGFEIKHRVANTDQGMRRAQGYACQSWQDSSDVP